MKYTIELDKFGDSTSLVERFKPRDAGNAKFNIKVRKSDLRLIDRLAELSGRSRAYVLNDLVQSILVEMLHEMHRDDPDFAALLARYVDDKCGKSTASVDGWSAAIFGVDSSRAQYYWHQFGQEGHEPSGKCQELFQRIKSVKK